MRNAVGIGMVALGLLAAGSSFAKKEEKKMDDRVFEMRTYHAAPGKMKALHARFRDHTCAVQEARHDNRGILESHRRQGIRENDGVSPGLSEQGGGGEELGGVSQRPFLAQGKGRLGS